MKEYETYFEKKSELKLGEEIELSIRDTETFEEHRVRAIVSEEEKEGWDKLLVEFGDMLGIARTPYYIKIVEFLEEPEVEIVVRTDKTRLAQRRGSMIRSMLEEREEKEKE